MKIYLVYPDISSFHGLPYQPGLASIASVLIDRGHEVKLSYFNNINEAKDILKEICAFKPEVIGFTAVETQFRYVRFLASEIKKVHKCLIICGGPYVTLAPEVVLERESSLDTVVIGEGEHAAAELAEKIEKSKNWRDTNNLAYKDEKTNNLIKNPLNPLIEDLDSLGHPTTELFPYQEMIDRENVAMFQFSRGCPYRCGFCSNTALGGVYGMPSNRIRMRSVESVIDEIETTLPKYRLRDDTVLDFVDDLFVFNKKWILDFCGLYRNKIGRPFWCTGRSNHITGEICASLKDAGCVMMMMSVESGNDYIRNKVMLRNITRETMFKSFEICHKHGINTLATCIIGLPFETPEMVEDSIKTVAKLKSITAYGVNIFYPYKGTYLRKVCEEKGFMPKEGIKDDFIERTGSILNLPDLPNDKILYYSRNWIRLIMKYKGVKERIKYAIRNSWDAFRKTAIGNKIRNIINDTRIGRAFKKYIMKHLWNRG